MTLLDGPLLDEHQCWFGGGTVIALANGEYRESVDIDFLVSDLRSYRDLRQMVKSHGLNGLARGRLDVVRAPTIDNYGIRTAIRVQDVAIKFEIVHEGRIALDTPAAEDEICGIRTLTRSDQVASKLLANDDRWADRSTFSRDLIDLAMMKPETVALNLGVEKAVDAYGATVGESLRNSIAYLRERPYQLDVCMDALQMDLTRATVWHQIRELESRCASIQSLG